MTHFDSQPRPELVRVQFPTEDLTLVDAARTFRYLDYLWADSLQVVLVVGGVSRLPRRTQMPRPQLARFSMSSPFVAEMLIGGGLMSTGLWFFRYALKKPQAIGSWWTEVKIGRARARLELEELGRQPPSSDAEAVDEAMRIGVSVIERSGEAAAEIEQARLRLEPEAVAGLDERAAELELAAPVDDDDRYDRARPRRAVMRDRAEEAEQVIRRYRHDAQRLIDTAGPPEITSSDG